ncbi:MAG: hypothetical protein M0P33_02025 [Massilibacteroides sp.]|nr:hypothetical protein [Massilibacteroides sp.]
MNEKEIDRIIDQALQEDVEVPKGFADRLEHTIENEAVRIPKFKTKHRHMWLWIATTAAVIAFCFYSFLPTSKQTESILLADTYTNPQDAERVARKAFISLSTNLNKGLDQIKMAEDEFKQAHKIFNKNLKHIKQ